MSQNFSNSTHRKSINKPTKNQNVYYTTQSQSVNKTKIIVIKIFNFSQKWIKCKTEWLWSNWINLIFVNLFDKHCSNTTVFQTEIFYYKYKFN